MPAQTETRAPDNPPYAREAEEVCRELGVDAHPGLREAEARARLSRAGPNALQTIRPRPAWRLWLDQFASLIVVLLAVAALIAWLTGDRTEALAILIVLLLNALIGFVVEWQAGRALDALRRQAVMKARVRRDGQEVSIDAAGLVPGDIVILNAGDRVPADARLVEAAALRAEESALTGESATVAKEIWPAGADTLLADRHCMLYLGTAIAAGRAVAVVTATGVKTELGRIGRLVASAETEPTPLEQRLDELGRRLVYLVIVIAVLVLLTGWARGHDPWLMAEVAISLAVAAVPEGLPAVTTLVLALGVLRMARRRALVRRLAAVETLGSATVICTDKTGTLTENRMTVREYQLADGTTHNAEAPVLLAEADLLSRAARAGVLCNEAVMNQEGGEDLGDPTETALLAFAARAGADIRRMRASYPELAQVPFDSVTRRMTTLHRAPDGAGLLALKGAPSAVLPVCSHYAATWGEAIPLDEAARARFLAVNDQMAARALRVLALAERRVAAPDRLSLPDLARETGYVFLGFAGMIDPPRAEVPTAIAQARAAGIRVVMLTGDQIQTARTIARELHLHEGAEPVALHARDLENADQQRIATLARGADVFARVSPEDKLRIVDALQQQGEIVAVTGDGVNDAPALKRASIGVAMGLRGTAAAREAADLILADDNFATIIHAIAGGRTIYANIIRYVHLMFTKNLAEVMVIFTALLVGWPLPLAPLQILWINLVTDVFLGLGLAVEPGSPEVMQRPPRPPREALLSRGFLWLIIWQGVMLTAIILAAYAWALRQYGPGAHARTMALFSLIGAQLGHMFNCRSRLRSALTGLWTNPFIWLAALVVVMLQGPAIWWDPLARALDVTPPNPRDTAVIVISALAPVLIVELAKLWRRSMPAPRS
ncbi:MAG: cation-translocating P-type ATPase [Blastocatellia bacterium]